VKKTRNEQMCCLMK